MAEATSLPAEHHVAVPLQVLKFLKALVVAAGLSGVFITLGFLVDVSYQDRLGFRLREQDNVVGLALEGGKFILASFEVLLNAVTHWVFVLVVIVLSLAGIFLYRRMIRPEAHLRLAALALVSAQLVGLGLFDLPAVQVHGLLIHGPSPTAPPLLQRAWLDQICSRVSLDQQEQLRDFLVHCTSSPRGHARSNSTRYALNLLTTSLFSLFALVLMRQVSWRPVDHRRRFVHTAAAAALCLAAMDLLLLPYTYGKTIKPTRVSEALVYHNLPNVDDPVHAFVLFGRAQELVLFHKGPREQQIWVLPRERVRLVKIEHERDVVEYFIRRSLQGAPHQPPADQESP